MTTLRLKFGQVKEFELCWEISTVTLEDLYKIMLECMMVSDGVFWSRDGERILEFADSVDMMIGNTFFKKDNEKLITYKSGDAASVIDYVMVKKEIWKNVENVKAIPGEECFSQHRSFILDLTKKHRAAREMRKPERIRL